MCRSNAGLRISRFYHLQLKLFSILAPELLKAGELSPPLAAPARCDMRPDAAAILNSRKPPGEPLPNHLGFEPSEYPREARSAQLTGEYRRKGRRDSAPFVQSNGSASMPQIGTILAREGNFLGIGCARTCTSPSIHPFKSLNLKIVYLEINVHGDGRALSGCAGWGL
jgi:hypothetical protein